MFSDKITKAYLAGEDFIGDGTFEIGYAVKFDANKRVVKCTVKGEKAIGLSASTGRTGQPIRVLMFGQGEAKANADLSALAPGTELTTESTGKVIAANLAGDFIIGVVEDASKADADGNLLKIQARAYYKHA